jgi:hypothetical protein
MKKIFLTTMIFSSLTILAAQEKREAPAVDDAKRMCAEMMNPDAKLVFSERSSSGKKKVLIYGNSIALHRPAEHLGWKGEWGMAASSREKDFAHLVIEGLEKECGESVDFRIRNLALIERNYTKDIREYEDILSDIKYNPDYVVIAIGENVPHLDKKGAKEYTKMLISLASAFTKSPKRPRVVMRSPFWKNKVKAECTEKAAKVAGAIYVDAGHLGEKDENKAIGLFSHRGVAAHPGDLGMRRLADLILEAFK